MAELSTLGAAIKTAYEGQDNVGYLGEQLGIRSGLNLATTGTTGLLSTVDFTIDVFGDTADDVELTLPTPSNPAVLDQVRRLVTSGTWAHDVILVDDAGEPSVIRALKPNVVYWLRWRGTGIVPPSPRWNVEYNAPRRLGSTGQVLLADLTWGAVPAIDPVAGLQAGTPNTLLGFGSDGSPEYVGVPGSVEAVARTLGASGTLTITPDVPKANYSQVNQNGAVTFAKGLSAGAAAVNGSYHLVPFFKSTTVAHTVSLGAGVVTPDGGALSLVPGVVNWVAFEYHEPSDQLLVAPVGNDLISTQAGNDLTANPKFWVGSQAEYDALTKNANTIYYILA